MPEVSEVLTLEKLCSGDRPSALIAGMMLAHALNESRVAVVSVDALGRVILLPPSSVKILQKPRLSNDDLDSLEEDMSIQAMVHEDRSEDEIFEYLRNRKSREA